MKHIKSISELFKSTYISAADKAHKYGHDKKSEDLRKHGEYKGKSNPVDRIFPHRFVFDHINRGEFREYVRTVNKEIDTSDYKIGGVNTYDRIVSINPPYFFITGYKVMKDSVQNIPARASNNYFSQVRYIVNIKVEFESNYGKKIELDCNFSIEDSNITIESKNFDVEMRLIIPGYSEYFKFKNRQDAVQFKKFLIEDFTPEFLEDIEDYPTNNYAAEADQQIGVIDAFKEYEDGKFHWVNGDGIPSIYIGFLKGISVNSMYRDPK